MHARAVKETVIDLNFPPETVFPLLCPVREHAWLEPWSADILYSQSGLAEKDAVFTTSTEDGLNMWVITRYEPNRAIAMVSVLPHSHTRNLEVRVGPTPSGCRLNWRMVYTALTPQGEAWIREELDRRHALQLDYLQQALIHFLETGTCLTLEMHHARR